MGFFKTVDEKIQDEKDRQNILKKKIEGYHLLDDLRKEKDTTRKAWSIFFKAKKLNARAIKDSIVNKLKPGKVMLIHMELRNGFHTQFLVSIQNSSFKYQKAEYIIDDDLKYYDITASLWCLDYHQDLPVPILRRIDVNSLKKAVRGTGITDIDTAFNPTTLRQFIESEVIQKVMKGQEMDKVFTFLKFTTIATLILSLTSALILIQSSGVLSNMSIPFLGG